MQAPAIQAIIDSIGTLARGLDINGTPEFIVGTTPVSGALGLKDLNNLVGRVRQEKR
jgi:protein-disulfide isomerase